jgi:hypothetical protein
MRVAPPRIDPALAGAPRPPAGAPGADAHRQTTFVLGGEVDHILEGLDLEATAARASAGAHYRKQVTAAAMMAWSRSWLARLQALHATQLGNYAAALPLVRAAADYEAASIAMLESEAAEWEEWLATGGVAREPRLHATAYRLHPFRSAETLAAHPGLGRVYREASDLAMPHFGATLLVAGSESGPERILATFGDRDFHLGLAELVLGWLAALGEVQLGAIADHPAAIALPDPGAAERWRARAAELIARSDRCRLEVLDTPEGPRTVVQDWRKRPGDAPRRIVL